MSSEKITVHNLADLKNTSDDALPNYLNSLKFTQSHALTDVRLALGYSAFLIAGACFLWDYKLGFDSTKYYTAAAVVLYSILNGALTLWIWLKEAGTVYEGTSPSGEKVNIATSTKKNVPTYNMKITLTSKNGENKVINLSQPFNQWFDSQGRFVAVPFQEILATNIPAVGKLDPKRIASTSQGYSTDVLDALYAENTATGSGAEAAKGGSKRRKA
ncbi:microsomal signal peptidase 25 kDa subunit [Colletotrichum abscissum]|uniref:Signal peptidase complex subunit 2 n=2 Tax=Colletotrichum acutatum species complex TaxID=2707335 RepID=A0A9Q0B1V6_9PEZI|nr:microsomal signal peptidase 25 kDa subunit [Colletotrichum lupini]XP_060396392.1 microsomal signal peptidase 25 kDa subunit [Colletotrichum abscissum]KAI3544365.1 microsomal signal peptidase 25 kDa subunit [Colletotrichum abscissum]KAK1489923.1 microsomal signal peptidase 25 kDa subunit [Colletotrichum abscissum]KAK1710187.1 microsomal signal peptidase 25 kDa subunit [Colletotrichum lupini]UQC86769.1 microsomal signal peptidase 25 kDa subunit [Colletotrichum lupini]